MILLDDRIGSRELLGLIRTMGCQAELGRLDYGDAYFDGNGPDGPIAIGVERKRINDALASMRDRRLAGHQLPGMQEMYQRIYLVIEGLWKPGKAGELLIWSNGDWRLPPASTRARPMVYAELDNFITSMEEEGVRIRRTASAEETARVMVDLYRRWGKKWTEHKLGRTVYATTPVSHRVKRADFLTCVLAQFPGLDTKAFDAREKFKTMEEVVKAGEKDWMKVKGVGKVLAERYVRLVKKGEV